MKREIPRHLGLILDGNRRWARSQGMSTLEGHRTGYENLKTIATAAFESGVDYVSAYIFSTENWNRSEDEVGYLMNLVVKMASRDLDELIKKNVKVVVLGTRDRLSKTVLKALEQAEQKSSENTKGTLVLCFNYGGQQEIVEAAQRLVEDGVDAGQVNQELFESYLYHPEVPPVDFMIRTSGEQRISNFMLWRMAYTELYFIDKHWPAFTVEDFNKALEVYTNRKRRFGA